MHAPPPDRQVLTPAQLNTLARDLLEGSFGSVWVEGELSNVSRPASGHLYFTLKDARAQVRCALFRQKAAWLRFAPADGMRVLARGKLTLYEPRGDYQLVLDTMEEAGEGALRRAFEQLKQRLAAEGLFEAARKRTLPAFVGRLAVLTSPRGAAVRDVLSVLARRFPLLEVDVVPVPVQGEGAAVEIQRALRAVFAAGRHDVVLLTRGGGSLEDLWAFNDEGLARLVAAAPVPVVSAVGHEIDTSLTDFAADVRAATPSAAAELLVPERGELLARVARLGQRLDQAHARAARERAQRLDQAWLRLQAWRPHARLERGRARLAELAHRLALAARRRREAPAARLQALAARLAAQHPARRLDVRAQQLAALGARQRQAIARTLERRRARLQETTRALAAVSPLATLARGYAILTDADGRVLRAPADATPGQRLQARLAGGTLGVIAAPD